MSHADNDPSHNSATDASTRHRASSRSAFVPPNRRSRRRRLSRLRRRVVAYFLLAFDQNIHPFGRFVVVAAAASFVATVRGRRKDVPISRRREVAASRERPCLSPWFLRATKRCGESRLSDLFYLIVFPNQLKEKEPVCAKWFFRTRERHKRHARETRDRAKKKKRYYVPAGRRRRRPAHRKPRASRRSAKRQSRRRTVGPSRRRFGMARRLLRLRDARAVRRNGSAPAKEGGVVLISSSSKKPTAGWTGSSTRANASSTRTTTGLPSSASSV